MNIVHTPVMLNECLSYIPNNAKYVIDATLGEGGHTLHMLEKGQNVIAIERDINILAKAKERLSDYKNIEYLNITYDNIINSIDKSLIGNIDYILFDLGVSMYHFKEAGRGFSFKDSGKLDMRLGLNSISAFEVINKYSEQELVRVFREYGEIKTPTRLVSSILEARKSKRIENTSELEDLAYHNIKHSGRDGIHPATLVFQALRIEVNDELNILDRAIKSVSKLLKVGGRVVVLSYHSLEDRIVKQYFKNNEKTKNKDGEFVLLNKHVIVASDEEKKINAASRSAKLRAAERV